MYISPQVLNAFEAWAKDDKKTLAKIFMQHKVEKLLLKYLKNPTRNYMEQEMGETVS